MHISKLGRNLIFGSMALGALFFGFALWFITEAMLSKNWPKVDAIVTNTKVESRLYNVSDRLRSRIEYIVVTEYLYDINGTEYSNTSVSLGEGSTLAGPFNEKSQAWDWIKASNYQSGDSIFAYVNPKNPERSILRAGINIGTIVPLILGLLLLSPGLLFKFWKPQASRQEFSQIHLQK